MKILFALLAALTLSACAVSTVPPGNVGVKVYLNGSVKGVDHEVLPTGRYYLGVNEKMYLFPTYTQNYVWTKSPHEGSPEDESISFQTNEGLSVNADIGVSYAIEPDKVALVFQKYRRGVEEITDTFLRNMVRDSLVNEASTLPIESVYGKGKGDLIAKVQKDVAAQVEPIGIHVEKIYWIGDLRLPPQVTNAINAKITATQTAMLRENEVAQAKAEADKRVAQARGEADALLLQAKANAEAIKIKGEALAAHPELIQLSAVEKWDGVLPQMTGGGAIPFLGNAVLKEHDKAVPQK